MVRAPAARPVHGSLAASQSAARSLLLPAPPHAAAHARPRLFLRFPLPAGPPLPRPPSAPGSRGTRARCVSPDRARCHAARPLLSDTHTDWLRPARRSRPSRGVPPNSQQFPPILPHPYPPRGTDWAPLNGGARLPGEYSPLIGSRHPDPCRSLLPFVCFLSGGGEPGVGGAGEAVGAVA